MESESWRLIVRIKVAEYSFRICADARESVISHFFKQLVLINPSLPELRKSGTKTTGIKKIVN